MEDPKPEPYISPSDEAFLVWVWENYYDRWEYQAECIKNNKNKDKKDPAYKNPDAKDGEGKYLEPKMETPYSSATSGQQKHGGVTEIGKQRLRELEGLVKANRQERAAEVYEIDSAVLDIVQKNNNSDAIDNNARRRRRGSLAGGAESDEDLDVDDITGWWLVT